ncbi:MAG: DUF3833 domain-containing protein [Rubricella sp.]
MRILVLAFLLPLLAACSGRPSLDTAYPEPELVLEAYFDGDLIAHGQFQDLFGEVRRRFVVEIDGTWDGETLTLVEDFVYEDGSTEQRIWTLMPTGPDTWEGTAPGVIGTAEGRLNGSAFNWEYVIDLPLADGETMRVGFDDWMWLIDEDVLLNRAYMYRYGIRIGEVIITFRKLD